MSVLIGFIPTEDGERAIRAGIDWAKAHNSPVTLLNLVQEGLTDPRFASEDDLAAAANKVRAAGVEVSVVKRPIEPGTAYGQALLEAAAEQSPQLLVIAVRRNREFAPHLLGTTVQQLLVDAPCELLVA